MVNAHAGLLRDVVALLDQAADLDKKYIDRCISACITPVFRESTPFSFNYYHIRHRGGGQAGYQKLLAYY